MTVTNTVFKTTSQGFKRSYTGITGEIHGPPKSLPKKGGILPSKGDTMCQMGHSKASLGADL